MPAPPPEAAIGTARGELGSYTWDGVIGDAPWIVPRKGMRATPGASILVAFGALGDATTWGVAWAPIRDGAATSPSATASGKGSVRLVVPNRTGTWSLRVTARFGEGREATWFWKVVVGP
jgi:hypothetical protein